MRYGVYGDRSEKGARALVAALSAKAIDFDFVDETASLALALASRSGCDRGPYLRTPEGFVLGDLHATLDYLDRIHPETPWRPRSPVRRIGARILEDWIELWLPVWPARARGVLEGLAKHLDATGFLMGAIPCRPDGSLAAWLQAEIFPDAELRTYLERHAPGILRYSERVATTSRIEEPDDALPLSLLAILAEIAADYFVYLAANRAAIDEGIDRVEIELELGRKTVPVWRHCEERRAELAREIEALPARDRRTARQMLEPLGAWRMLALPSVLGDFALDDPRQF